MVAPLDTSLKIWFYPKEGHNAKKWRKQIWFPSFLHYEYFNSLAMLIQIQNILSANVASSK